MIRAYFITQKYKYFHSVRVLLSLSFLSPFPCGVPTYPAQWSLPKNGMITLIYTE